MPFPTMFMSKLINMLHSSTTTKKVFSKACVKKLLAEFKIHSEVHSGTNIMHVTLLTVLRDPFKGITKS